MQRRRDETGWSDGKNGTSGKISKDTVPIQRGSEIKANLLLGPTSIHNFPSLTTGQLFLHSWLHFFGLHFSALIIAIRVKRSFGSSGFDESFFLGGMVDYLSRGFNKIFVW
jgi:hypothetical protein